MMAVDTPPCASPPTTSRIGAVIRPICCSATELQLNIQTYPYRFFNFSILSPSFPCSTLASTNYTGRCPESQPLNELTSYFLFPHHLYHLYPVNLPPGHQSAQWLLRWLKLRSMRYWKGLVYSLLDLSENEANPAQGVAPLESSGK